MTVVDRATSCILAWAVEPERTEATLQGLVDDAPPAAFYFSDLFALYRRLVYAPGHYTPMPDKSQTYRVEGDNAELRHYLARLGRQSRCFSRCIHALRRAVRLFVFAWNSRQLYRRRFPKYPANLIDFLYP
jgi:IS1 family transposase